MQVEGDEAGDRCQRGDRCPVADSTDSHLSHHPEPVPDRADRGKRRADDRTLQRSGYDGQRSIGILPARCGETPHTKAHEFRSVELNVPRRSCFVLPDRAGGRCRGPAIGLSSCDRRTIPTEYPLNRGTIILDFADRTVLVTGASRGIGRAIATRFAARGARVALHYHRNRAAAEETLASLEGGPHHLIQAAIADRDAARTLVEETIETLGGLDIVVNNAGIFEPHPPLEVSYDEWCDAWEATLSVNLLGPAYISYWAARHMVEAGGGRIINITSRGAFRGEPDTPAYGASKAGLNSMSQSLAKALAPHGVYIYAVAPGWVATDMAATSLAGEAGEAVLRESPMGRVVHAEEIAHTVLFLASEGAESVTGAIVDVNGASYLRS